MRSSRTPFTVTALAVLALAPVSATSVAATPRARLLGHHETGKQPTTVTPSRDGSRLFVACRGDQSVQVFDADSMKVLETHSLIGHHGAWQAVPLDEERVLVSNWIGETLSLLRRSSGEVERTLRVGIKPSYVAVSPDGSRAYAAGYLSGDLTLLDLETGEPDRVLDVGQKPMGVAISPDGRWLYVASCRSNQVNKIDLKYEVELDSFGVPLAETTNLAISPDGGSLLMAGRHDRLIVLDTETGRDYKVSVGREPAAVAISPDGRTAFVANYRGASVGVVDLARREMVDELPVGPGCIDVATDGRRLWSCSDKAGAVTAWSLEEPEPVELPPAVETQAPEG